MRYIRKIPALLLACVLFMTALPQALSAAEYKVGDSIPLTNAGFEDSETFPDGWSIKPAVQDTAAYSIDTSKAYSGKHSLKFENLGINPWIKQTVTCPVKGAMYEFSAWLNNSSTSAGIFIEQWDIYGNFMNAYEYSETLKFNTNDRWNRVSLVFPTDVTTKTIDVYIILRTNGVAWFDDCELKVSDNPDPYSYYADHVFHYPDEEEGHAWIYLTDFYDSTSPEATSVSGRFTFYDKDGETILDQKEIKSFTNKEMKYTYPVALMQEKQEKYSLKVELLDAGGTPIRTWQENKYIYDRPTSMDKEGHFYDENGNLFNPIVAYTMDIEAYDEIAEGGWNVTTTGGGFSVIDDSRRDEYFKAMEENGIKCLFNLYPDMLIAGHPNNIERTKKVVEKYKDNPTIFAWMVMDEPLGGKVDTDQKKLWLEESYKVIREIDPYHPIYLVDYGLHAETIKYCDVFSFDIYGWTQFASSDLFEPIAEAHRRVPIMEIAACYKNNGVFPPVKTTRGFIHRSLATHRAFGAGWYSILNAIGHDPGDTQTPLYETEYWEPVVTINTVELPILFEYVNGKGITVFSTHKEGELYKEIFWETWFNEKGEMYVWAHNRSREKAEFNIPLVSNNGKIRIGSYTAEPIGLTPTGALSGDGSMQFTLEGEEAAIYKVSPSEKVDLSSIDAPRFTDMDGDYAWAAEAVSKLDNKGIVNTLGDSLFAPGEAITRADLAMFLIRTLGFTAEGGEDFADVSPEAPYAKELRIGRALGILEGVGDNLFNPDLPITRQDMMTICARGMRAAEKLAAAEPGALDAFLDKENVADYARESVSAMIQSGIIKGDDAGYLNPTGNTRRAEAAVIMQRILDAKKIATDASGNVMEPVPENEVVEFEAASAEAKEKYDSSAALLTGLGMPQFDVDKSITCGEAETAMSALLGYTYDGFGENYKALKTADAVEALVKLLGYEVYTARDGGYMGTASFIDLTKGIDVSAEYLRGGEFALLIENALGIYLVDPAGYGGESEGTYAESEDTLLTRYRHLTLYKGVVEQNENTGIGRGKVVVGKTLLETGATDAKALIGQKVEAYTEGEENTIIYIRPASRVTVTSVPAEKISRAETTMSNFVYEDETGHTKSISTDGAKVLYNGKYKTPDANTFLPETGTVTLIENGGAGADFVLVWAYNNYIVDKIWAEDSQIFFKNRAELVWDADDNSKFLTMEGGTFEGLREWNVISLYESEDKTVMRAVVNTKTANGTITEKSDDEIRLGEETLLLAKNFYGTIELGEKYTLLLDAEGKACGINDEALRKNYVYLTSVHQGKGLDDKVQMRIFNQDAEMLVMDVKDPVDFNGTPTSHRELMTKTELFSGDTTKGQLIVMETVGDLITGFETAVDMSTPQNPTDDLTDARLSVFSMDMETGNTKSDPTHSNVKSRYYGHVQRTLADKYFVPDDIVIYRVPAKYSEDPNDYEVRRLNDLVSSERLWDTYVYDIDENYEIGCMVTVVDDFFVKTISDGTLAVVQKFGMALNEDGEPVISVTLGTSLKEDTYYFVRDDLPISMEKCITSVAKGEPCVTNGTVNGSILPKNLEIGDVVSFETSVKDAKCITGMRVLCRGNYAEPKYYAEEGLGVYYTTSQNTRAFGKVERVLERGVVLRPNGFEMVFVQDADPKTWLGIYLCEDGEVKKVTQDHIRKDDMVFVQKTNPYPRITVIYR